MLLEEEENLHLQCVAVASCNIHNNKQVVTYVQSKSLVCAHTHARDHCLLSCQSFCPFGRFLLQLNFGRLMFPFIGLLLLPRGNNKKITLLATCMQQIAHCQVHGTTTKYQKKKNLDIEQIQKAKSFKSSWKY